MTEKILPIIDQSKTTLILPTPGNQAENWYQNLLAANPDLARSNRDSSQFDRF